MSTLKSVREHKNLTQQELSNKSKISVRTIQRIEAGTKPKGHTLKSLSKALNINEKELQKEDKLLEFELESEELQKRISIIKFINLSLLPFIFVPPINILLPIILMLVTKIKNPIVKQIISLQIMWTILAPILFMIGVLFKVGNQFTIFLLIFIFLSNIFIILKNAMEIDQNKKLYFKLNFSML